MTVQTIGSAGAVLFLSASELRGRGLVPEQLAASDAAAIAREAFCRAGLSPDGELEVDAYPGKGGVLLLARLSRTGERLYSFPDWQTLLDALKALDEPLPGGSLSRWGERLWLGISGESRAAGMRLREFARYEGADPVLCARLRECGERLLEGDAPTVVHRLFGSKQ